MVTSSLSQEELDSFLTIVESKLRGPFSSLDLAKAATSTRSTPPRLYLEHLSKVIHRMDKVTKLRVMVGLLGLDPSEETDGTIYDILSHTQDHDLSEEWVKVVAGLIRGIMFVDHHDVAVGNSSRESCRGEKAQSLLERSCTDVMERVMKNSNHKNDDCDLEPLFAPYHYSLLSSDSLKEVLPHCFSNPHFRVVTDAPILQEDEALEKKQAEEGDTQNNSNNNNRQAQAAATSTNGNTPKPQDLPTMPGIRALNKPKSKPTAQKTSMFMPSKKPAGAGRTNMAKSTLHTRKGARALLANGRRSQAAPGAAAVSSSRNSVAAARKSIGTKKHGSARSRMKVLDVSEVQGLRNEARERESDLKDSKAARKRKLMEAAAAKGLVKKTRVETHIAAGRNKQSPSSTVTPEATQAPPAATGNNAPGAGGDGLVAAALLAYQQQVNGSGASAPQAPAPADTEWQELLEKSNKLSPEDRERVRQFFVDRYNPTPGTDIYRMRLHEEKSTEKETGATIKETLYLELDYNTFGFRKLRKTKRK